MLIPSLFPRSHGQRPEWEVLRRKPPSRHRLEAEAVTPPGLPAFMPPLTQPQSQQFWHITDHPQRA